MKSWIENTLISPLKRRSFMKWGSAMGGAAAIAGSLPLKSVAKVNVEQANENVTKTTWSACLVNCGSRCALRLHTRDGVITSVETDNTGDENTFGLHQIRACLRGRSIKHRVYNPDRLKYPMKRVGKRGEGRFERISWDEALDLMADQLKDKAKRFGNDSIFCSYGSGTTGYRTDGRNALRRLLNMTGGYLNYYGNYSWGQIQFALPYTYGSKKPSAFGSYTTEIENSNLLVMFGYNPAETRMSGGGEIYEHMHAMKKRSVRTIIIEPRYTDTMLGKEDEWIPIRPGTDAALVEGIAHVLISENLVDQAFLDKYCQGFDEKSLPASAPKNGHYKAHIMGQGPDGVEKTPEWAAKITGIPVKRIIKLAREIGNAKPAYIVQGTGIQRQANGEQTARSIVMLPILTGNIGLPGTHTGDMPANYNYPVPRLPTGANPVKASIPFFKWTDAIIRADEMTDKTDGLRNCESLNNAIKMIICYSGNFVNQHAQSNRTAEILKDESLVEFITVIDNHMTPSARYADLLLPDVTYFENTEVTSNGYASGSQGVVFPMVPAIKPMYECRSAYDFCSSLAERFGIREKYTEGRTHEEWVEYLYAGAMAKDPQLPSLKDLQKNGPYKTIAPEEGRIALEDFRNDPETHALGTPSGKIEIYSTRLEQIAREWTLPEGDVITPLPQYVTTWESHLDPLTEKFPLQLIGFHTKGRVHSTYHNIPELREAVIDGVWINPRDAEARGIKNGDSVRIWNDRGETRVLAKVTPRIIPGVMALGEGAWYTPDRKGVDQGGCINTLTSHRNTPLSKGNPQHTNLVEIAKV
ncbi:DMSO/selenate family reductase complex A subunit [Sansalvadorimonas verongulae]|uniref:DMSO/selenate family reductase complex A subunit n=1 Tax=Sansalvadorimonas verongulae TaxID=2172824 RepID=UPI0012BCE14C|nr:DMSO/selenate family reductase complex A subunit [Sansalvadorimonas verongulae]MTI15346.1 dimethyl sulfoxide reductase subunit A [Sansalvadorimonas verongulae]